MEIAIREAVRRSPYPKRDALITLQADFTEDPDVVPALIKRIEAGADIVTTAVVLDENTPRAVRYARRLFKWLLRGKEWMLAGEPFSGLRAYRIMTVKRALDGRGAARLLSWEGWAAHAELLAQTAPHSRRNDAVECTLHYRRLQRASRFRFMPMLSQVMGVRSDKPSRAQPVSLPDTTIAVPASLAVELATSHRREEARRREESRGRRDDPRRRRSPRDARPERGPRSERAPRAERGPRPERKPRPERTTRPTTPAAAEATPLLEAAAAETQAQPAPQRKRRRSRRRSRNKSGQPNQQPQEMTAVEGEAPVVEITASENGDAAPEQTAEAARKKSRRGRRGGRGRKRGTRPGVEGQPEGQPEEKEAQTEIFTQTQDNAGEAPASE